MYIHYLSREIGHFCNLFMLQADLSTWSTDCFLANKAMIIIQATVSFEWVLVGCIKSNSTVQFFSQYRCFFTQTHTEPKNTS